LAQHLSSHIQHQPYMEVREAAYQGLEE